jgi:beta-N-acetylhexosaminidase
MTPPTPPPDPNAGGRRAPRPIPRRATRRRAPRRALLFAALIGTVLILGTIVGIVIIPSGRAHRGGTSRTSTFSKVTARATAGGQTPTALKRQWSRHATTTATRDAERDLGEMIVSRLGGTVPSPALLARVRAGQLGGVILFSENFAAGSTAAAHAIGELQQAARSTGTWPLLIMTDQEGGEVRRLADAPPKLAPREMASWEIAHSEGLATGRVLKSVGVNIDLAPVADVEQVPGSFLAARSFGASPQIVAARACAFARGLSEAGIGYTLKHFPGLGTASSSTDTGPVSIGTPASALRANYAAYSRCGHGDRTLVMISSAAYPTLTGTEVPALDAPEVYRQELRRAGIQAVTISDDLQAGALTSQEHPALRALRAGLDLLLYAQSEHASSEAYAELDDDLHNGNLSAARVQQAADAITHLKAALAK